MTDIRSTLTIRTKYHVIQYGTMHDGFSGYILKSQTSSMVTVFYTMYDAMECARSIERYGVSILPTDPYNGLPLCHNYYNATV